ncbi:MAG: F0F1 ATP synthase subunit beta, partial [Bacteroidia bacterium]|nr:F0F1 ATP synthase subunit beta [Bacteroidia bacterium]
MSIATEIRNIGKISQVIGPVVDVDFTDEGAILPQIYDALTVEHEGKTIYLEVQQHLGENRVRTISMDSTYGLRRGMEVVHLGRPISVPVGPQIRGRLFNVVGQAIDGIAQPQAEGYYPIHKPAPKFDDLATEAKVLYTGIKVIDLLAPYLKGGKIGLFGGAGVGKTV